MKYISGIVVSILFLFILTGCSTQSTTDHIESGNTLRTIADDTSIDEEKDVTPIEATFAEENNVTASEITTEESSEETENNSAQGLSQKEIENAKKAAMDYYSETIFHVIYMEYIEPNTNSWAEGECNFSVKVSKDGVTQEAERTVCLDQENGKWKVINEGY